MKKEFKCYEIWRTNIPANGCIKQCKECSEIEANEKKTSDERNKVCCFLGCNNQAHKKGFCNNHYLDGVI